jgi:hypothetical protein
VPAARSSQLAAQPAGPTGGVDHQVRVEPGAVHQQPARPAAVRADPVRMPEPQLQPGLLLGRRAQRPLEDHPAAAQPGDLVRLLRHARRKHRLGTGDEQRLPHVGHLGGERLPGLLPERVRVVELHHAAAGPGTVRGRARITVDDRDRVPAAGEGDSDVEPARAGADDGSAHGRPSGVGGSGPSVPIGSRGRRELTCRCLPA